MKGLHDDVRLASTITLRSIMGYGGRDHSATILHSSSSSRRNTIYWITANPSPSPASTYALRNCNIVLHSAATWRSEPAHAAWPVTAAMAQGAGR
jgi:hypothetical protein